MSTRLRLAVFTVLVGATAIRAANIEGTVVIKRKLTRNKVTASTGVYQRGVAVDLGSDRPVDPLAYERANVVIYIEGAFPLKPGAATMEQKGRRFIPEILVVPAGSAVSFPNLDPIFHNVFSLSKPKTFDLGNYPKDHTRTVTFPKPGIVFVHCYLHPNMAASIVVSPNHWSTRADESGRFVLSDVPPGKHRIVAWHKAAGFFSQTIEATENRGAAVQFFIPLDEIGGVQSAARR